MAPSRRPDTGITPSKQRSITSFFSPGSSSTPPTKSPCPSLPKTSILIPSQPSSLKTPSPSPPPPKTLHFEGDAIGKQIRVFSPLITDWRDGFVKSFDDSSGEHVIQYDDAEEECLNLKREKFEFVNTSPPKRLSRLRRSYQSEEKEEMESKDKDDDLVDGRDCDDSEDEDWAADKYGVEEEEEGIDDAKSDLKPGNGKRKGFGGSSGGGTSRKRKVTVNGGTAEGFNVGRDLSGEFLTVKGKEINVDSGGLANPAIAEEKRELTASGHSSILSGESMERFGKREAEKFAFLGKGRTDASGRKPGDPDYDPRTLKLPSNFLKSLSSGQRQWWEFKSKHMDKVLFFKMGKFYELYEMDAHIGAKDLDLQYMKGEQPHCGFPEKNFSINVEKLASKGYRVLVVEQTETPEQLELRNKEMGSKDKVVKREICAVVTKGTLVEGEMLSTRPGPNYLISVIESRRNIDGHEDDHTVLGICVADVSTSKFMLAQFRDDAERHTLRSILTEMRPVELVKPAKSLSKETEKVLLAHTRNPLINDLVPGSEFWDAKRTLSELRNLYKVREKNMVSGSFDVSSENTAGLLPAVLAGLENAAEDGQLAISALGGCLFYLRQAFLDGALLTFAKFELFPYQDFSSIIQRPSYMILDGPAMENLEIFENSSNGASSGTLFAQLDHCVTAFGKRLLKSWLARPLYHSKLILDRQDAIEELKTIAFDSAVEFRKVLIKLPDMERVLARLFSSSGANGRNAKKVVLYEDAAKKQLQEFVVALRGCQLMVESCNSFHSVIGKLKSSILLELICSDRGFPDIAPILKHFKDAFDWSEADQTGRIIPHEGTDSEYDTACKAVTDIEKSLQRCLKEQHDILKDSSINYATVGKERYLLEIPESLQRKISREYELQSSKKGYFRYRTPKIQMLVGKLSSAEGERETKLKNIQQRLIMHFSEYYKMLHKLVSVIAELDVLTSLTMASDYFEGPTCRPTILSTCSEPCLAAKSLGHPVLKSDTLSQGSFVPNDVNIGGAGKSSFIILTGPNMGGKSTFIRQVCLVVVLAQIGAYVPAESFQLSPVDRLFVRMGAKDHIMAGQSTFLTELSETADMLSSATHNSLVALDELGRGTSTSDGQAIAAAVLDHFLCKVGCRGIFSTHYHRLAVDYEKDPKVSLCHMACQVHKGDDGLEEVIFLYKLTSGACPKSYGVNVARLAGIPNSVLKRAASKSHEFETMYGKQNCESGRGSSYFKVDKLVSLIQEILEVQAEVKPKQHEVLTCMSFGLLNQLWQRAQMVLQ